jgi:hypothetical protein
MPRYSFHFWDGEFLADAHGEVLPDQAAAQLQAETMAYELAGEYGPGSIIVTNVDADGKTVLTVPIPAERRVH